jgi:uncharacterized heparinase superfamily protein
MAPNFAHGHADALAVQLRIGGSPVLIDPGTFQYGGEARWRSYFRSTAAHNTVTVDERSQATEAGPFLWASPFSCYVVHASNEPGKPAILIARHDGYEKLGVLHDRAILMTPGLVLIVDRLSGQGRHALALRWHFAGAAVRREGSAIALHDFPGFRCIASGGEALLLQGSETPLSGWWSEYYGAKRPISTLEIRRATPLPHDFVTVLELSPGADRQDAEAGTWTLRRMLDAMGGVKPAGSRAAASISATNFGRNQR